MAYIAGPVIREGIPVDPWVTQCYSIIERAANYDGRRAAIPYVEQSLEQAAPKEFAAQILSRIKDALSVIAVFLPTDPSTPVECAFAVREGKRVLLIHQGEVRVPRLLAGLPSVRMLVFDERRAFEEIRAFLTLE